MSDILIKGMELPKGNDYLHLIIQNGKVHTAISCGHLTTDEMNVAEAVGLPDSSWHTGTPTEEGLYVVLTKVTNKGIQSSEGAYILDWWDGYCFKNLKQMARHNPMFGNDVYSWVKWQKIEP